VGKRPSGLFWIVPLLFLLFLSACGRGHLDTLRFEGEKVLYAQTSRVQGLDPAKAGDVASSQSIARIYEGLLQYDYLARPYRVVPLLAEEMPSVSDDGLTYTFEIRKGIYFQDDSCFPSGKGRELTAGDFVYSIKRIADVKTLSSGYWVFNGRIAGLDAFRAASQGDAPTDYDVPVEGLRAFDRYTLQIQLAEPYPQLLWILAMHYSFAVPREAVEKYGDRFVNHPVGTGPYVLHKWKRNYRLEFIRNPKWAETGREEFYPFSGSEEDMELGLLGQAGAPLPFIDRLVYYVVGDAATQWMMFLTGQFSISDISRDNWDAVITPDSSLVEKLKTQGVGLLSTPTLDLYYIGFNMEDPVVGKNKKLRQALSCAFNQAEWAHLYNNQVLRAHGPVPVPLAGSRENPTPYSFDVEKAKDLLRGAGYPQGVDPATGRRLVLTMDSSAAGDSLIRQSNELICSFMSEIGVELRIHYSNKPTFFKRVQGGRTQMFRLSWFADYPDPQNFLQVFYGPNAHASNRAAYNSLEYNRLYEQARTMRSSSERGRLYNEMVDIVIEDCPWIFMHQPMNFVVTHRWVKNYKPHDFPYGMGKFRDVDMADWTAWKEEFGEKRLDFMEGKN